MGTTQEKFEYAFEAKDLIEQGINNLGGSITDQTELKDYADELQNIYDVLPKTSFQTGTDVTLENCLKGKLDFEDGKVGYGDTYQYSTNGYNVYAGSNDLYGNISNYTQFERTNVSNNELKLTKTSSGTTSPRFFIQASLESNTTYYVSMKIKGNCNTLRIGDWLDSQSVKATITPTTEYQLVSFSFEYGNQPEARIYFGNGDALIEVGQWFQIKELMISKTNTTSFEPYTNGASPNPSYPQTINSVTGNQDVVVKGKNMYDKSQTDYLYKCSMSDNIITSNEMSSSGRSFGFGTTDNDNYTIKNGEDIYVSADIRLKSGYALRIATLRPNVSMENRVEILNPNLTNEFQRYLFKTTNTSGEDIITGRIVIQPSSSNLDNAVLEVKNVMMSKVNGADYEEYVTPTSYQLSLGDRKVFEGDYLWIDKTTGKKYHHHKMGNVTFNGSEEWIKSASYSGNYYVRLAVPNAPLYEVNCKCNLTKNIANGVQQLASFNNCVMLDGGPNSRNINFKDINIATIEELKTFLSITNLVLIYPLETETDEEITGTLAEQLEAWYNAQSNNGTTIITSYGNLPMIIKCRALKGE